KRAGSTDDWEPEQTLHTGAPTGVTYSNTFQLSSEPDRIYNFYRGHDRNPHVMIGDAAGMKFNMTGRLLRWDKTPATGAEPSKITGASDRTSPYVRYVSDGVDTIHFITTEDHPRGYDNSIYHGFVRKGAVHDSAGRVVDSNLFDDDAKSPIAYTR